MDEIMKISKKYNIPIVEDSCHGILAKYKNKLAGTFGEFGCFSLHPLKNLNVWGDGGFVVIKRKKYFKKMMLLRNHGLAGRNRNIYFGYNSRLDTLQACVANHLFKKINFINKMRIKNSHKIDKGLKSIKKIIIKKRHSYLKKFFICMNLELKT